MAQGELKGKGEMETQEWNVQKKGAACISTGLEKETPVPVKLQDVLSLNSGQDFTLNYIENIWVIQRQNNYTLFNWSPKITRDYRIFYIFASKFIF